MTTTDTSKKAAPTSHEGIASWVSEIAELTQLVDKLEGERVFAVRLAAIPVHGQSPRRVN